jgi:nitrogen fixation NifU-like protein
MSALYTEIIQDAYRNPQHRGAIEPRTHEHEDENPLCGDVVKIQLRVEDGTIADAGFQGRGCAISQASAELLLDSLVGQPVARVAELTRDDVLAELGIPSISPARLKCALLPLEVLRGAVRKSA